jgi:hypothetical protein
VLAVTALIEWCSLPEEGPATTAGTVQVGLVVLSGLCLTAGSLVRNLALVEANVPLVLGGVVVFLARVGPRVFDTGWWRRPQTTWLGISTLFLAADVGLFSHAVYEVGRHRYPSIDQVPTWLVFAVDHITFVAVMTTALFGTIASQETGAVWGWSDVPAAWGIAIGLIGSTAAIGAGNQASEDVFISILGLAVGVATIAALLRAQTIATY